MYNNYVDVWFTSYWPLKPKINLLRSTISKATDFFQLVTRYINSRSCKKKTKPKIKINDYYMWMAHFLMDLENQNTDTSSGNKLHVRRSDCPWIPISRLPSRTTQSEANRACETWVKHVLNVSVISFPSGARTQQLQGKAEHKLIDFFLFFHVLMALSSNSPPRKRIK